MGFLLFFWPNRKTTNRKKKRETTVERIIQVFFLPRGLGRALPYQALSSVKDRWFSYGILWLMLEREPGKKTSRRFSNHKHTKHTLTLGGHEMDLIQQKSSAKTCIEALLSCWISYESSRISMPAKIHIPEMKWMGQLKKHEKLPVSVVTKMYNFKTSNYRQPNL